ncbi:MAG: RNA polymerase sigma factor [Chloroflexota bacterium]
MSGALDRVEPREHAADVPAVYLAIGRELKRYVRSLVPDDETADDVVQEAFLRLVHEIAAKGGPNEVRPWLYRVAGNLARSRSRRARIAERWNRLFAAHGVHPSPDDTAIRREDHERIDRALRCLSTEARSAFLLSADGFTGLEIADILGRSHGATRTILWRARLALREALDAEADR